MRIIRKNLDKVIKLPVENLWNTCAEVLDLIESREPKEQASYLKAFLADYDLRDIEIQKEVNVEDYGENKGRYDSVAEIANRFLPNMIKANPDEDTFYIKLWQRFHSDDLFPDREDRIALLTKVWVDPRIPYYKISEGIKMENDEFERINSELSEAIKKARFIVYVGIQQRTQRASLLMDLAKEIQDPRQRSVFWSVVFSMLLQKDMVLFKRLLEKAESRQNPG